MVTWAATGEDGDSNDKISESVVAAENGVSDFNNAASALATATDEGHRSGNPVMR